jgi:hypothetical protein
MKNNSLFRWMVCFIIFAGLLPVINLFHDGLPVTHDGQDHVARIANFYTSLLQGSIVPRWAGNLNWGYGHPILMFLYPLPSYVASFFHFVGFSFVDSTKLVFGVSFVVSMLTMYFWASSVWGPLAGVSTAILYGFAPYRFIDLYVRGALGEHVAFIFPPLICWGLWKAAKQRTVSRVQILMVTIGLMFLILSHNAVSLMFLPIIFCYGIYLYFYETEFKKQFVIISLTEIVFGFLLSGFFWIPALLEGKYTLRNIVTNGDISGRFVNIWSFFYSPWNYGGGNEFSKSLGWPQMTSVLLGFGLVWKFPGKVKIFFFGLLFILFISLFGMTQYSNLIWSTFHILQNFQFPWRLLTVSVFVMAATGGFIVNVLKGSYKIFVSVVLCISAILLTVYMWHPIGYKTYNESFFTAYFPGTTDTGESSPIWSVRFMEKFSDSPLDVIAGSVNIKTIQHEFTNHVYHVEAPEDSMLVENTLYFPGWKIYIDGREIMPEYQNPVYRGLMTFPVQKGSHNVNVVFSDTKLRKFANLLSGVSAGLFMVILATMSLWTNGYPVYLSQLRRLTKKKI